MRLELPKDNPDIEEIIEEIKCAFPDFEENHDRESLEKLISIIRGKDGNSVWKPIDKYIVIKQGSVYKKIMLRDIIFAETFERKLIIHTKDCDIDYYGKLRDLETVLGEGFFRTHRAYIVNMKYVESFDVESVKLPSGRAMLSKTKYPEFVKEMKRYSENHK